MTSLNVHQDTVEPLLLTKDVSLNVVRAFFGRKSLECENCKVYWVKSLRSLKNKTLLTDNK